MNKLEQLFEKLGISPESEIVTIFKNAGISEEYYEDVVLTIDDYYGFELAGRRAVEPNYEPPPQTKKMMVHRAKLKFIKAEASRQVEGPTKVQIIRDKIGKALSKNCFFHDLMFWVDCSCIERDVKLMELEIDRIRILKEVELYKQYKNYEL